MNPDTTTEAKPMTPDTASPAAQSETPTTPVSAGSTPEAVPPQQSTGMPEETAPPLSSESVVSTPTEASPTQPAMDASNQSMKPDAPKTEEAPIPPTAEDDSLKKMQAELTSMDAGQPATPGETMPQQSPVPAEVSPSVTPEPTPAPVVDLSNVAMTPDAGQATAPTIPDMSSAPMTPEAPTPAETSTRKWWEIWKK